jgi:tight adherence protein C
VVLAAAAAGCAGVGVAEAIGALLASARRRSAQARQAGGGVAPTSTHERPRSASRYGAAALRMLGALGRRLGAPAAPRDLAARLAAAGAPPRIGPAEVMAVKGGAALLVLIVVAPLLAALPGRLALLAGIGASCAGFLAPDVWLRRRARARGRAMAAEFGDVVDLLRVTVAAGLPFGRAVAEVGRRRRGPLATELRVAAARLELGAGLPETLALFVARCPIDGAGALAAAIERSARHGASPGPALGALAARARADRRRRLHERAARAAPQIQLVIALMLVPSVLLLVGAALVAGFAR